MSELNLLLGLAIVAAVISGLVSLVVVQLDFRQERKAERLRREEKVRDFQIALGAEIASDLLNMKDVDRAHVLAEMSAAFAADPGYAPVAPRIARNLVFDAIVPEIHILPGRVITPVVHYARLRQTLEHFVEDLRSDTYKGLSTERRLLVYSDYLSTYDRLQARAEAAAQTLNDSLGLNRSVGGRSRPGSAKGGAAAGDPLS